MIIQRIAKSASVFIAALQFLFEGGAQCAAPQEGTYAL